MCIYQRFVPVPAAVTSGISTWEWTLKEKWEASDSRIDVFEYGCHFNTWFFHHLQYRETSEPIFFLWSHTTTGIVWNRLQEPCSILLSLSDLVRTFKYLIPISWHPYCCFLLLKGSYIYVLGRSRTATCFSVTLKGGHWKHSEGSLHRSHDALQTTCARSLYTLSSPEDSFFDVQFIDFISTFTSRKESLMK